MALIRYGLQEGFSKTLEHMTFLNRFSVTQEMVEDNKIGLMRIQGQQIYGTLLPAAGKSSAQR